MNARTAEKPNKTTLKVVVVNVSTAFAGKLGRRVHIELVLMDGHSRYRINIRDERYTKTGHARAEWAVGDLVEVPDLGENRFISLYANQIKKVGEVPFYKPSELRVASR